MIRDADLRLLSDGSKILGAPLAPAQQEQVLRYLDLVYVWNRTAGLTTIPREAAIRLHVLDSLGAAASVVESPCVDLGTGAGLPGLILAIAMPDQQFVLVESNRKKCSFLLEAVRSLELRNVRVIQADVDTLVGDQVFPVVISRAFRQPAGFLATAARLATPDGRVILMMANPGDGELRELAAGAGLELGACRRFQLPEGGEPRAVVTFLKRGPAVSRETSGPESR